jgi:eukaryotic-like serine/threonine-protein kinase
MPLAPGERLGPYEILAPIGAGGMGEVYRARDTRLDRTVAIKVSKGQFSERFEREARAVAALNHPHICTLYDVGPNYLVMEYVDGDPLRGPLPPAKAVEYALQILDALRAAHEKGIIHRDLKPANILVTEQGVKLLDFGLAKVNPSGDSDGAETQTLELTRAGDVMGTPAYMPPEQWEGKPADARSDIYTFGCVLYEMLTGKRAGRERTPVRPAALENFVRACLANDPEARWQSAAEAKDRLAGALRFHKRLRFGVAAAAVAVLALGGAFFVWQRTGSAPLTDKDVLVLADFTNSTGDPAFDGALRQALTFQLERSPFLRIMDAAQVNQALQLMGRSPGERITNEMAREICFREREKATLGGSIAALGRTYLLALEAMNCQTGQTLAREQAEAQDKEHVLEALAKAATGMRAKLGESLGSIQGLDRLYAQGLEITTGSLEALQAFSVGNTEFSVKGSSANAIPHIRRATEIDPNFAMAFLVGSIMYGNVGDTAQAREFAEKAYALIDRVRSERERLWILAEHYRRTEQRDKFEETYELITRAYPRDAQAHGNLAIEYARRGESEKALTEYQAAVREAPRVVNLNQNLVGAYLRLERVEDAQAALDAAFERGMDIPVLRLQRLRIAYIEGDQAAAEKQIQWFVGKPEEYMAVMAQAENALVLGQPRKARELLGRTANLHQAKGQSAAMSAQIGLLSSGGPPPLPPGSTKAPVAGIAESPLFLYANGNTLLAAGKGNEAAAEFQKILDHKAANWSVLDPLAYLGVARGMGKAGDTARAKKAYQDLFALWKDAEPDLPLLLAARKEYAALQSK